LPELIFPLISDEEKSLKYRHLVVKIEQSNSVTTIEAEESLKKSFENVLAYHNLQSL